MGTPRIFSDSALTVNSSTELTGSSARHVGKVLRLQPGDSLILFDGSGSDFAATIKSVSKNNLTLSCDEKLSVSTYSPLQTELWQGISKGPRMDTVVQKATELGVHRIRPVFTRYGVVKLDAARSEKRVQHWRDVAISACEQCGRADIPEILPPLTFTDALEQLPADAASLMLAPDGDTTLPEALHADKQNIIMIGPEGGFSADEETMAREKGVSMVKLGNRILRTETAPVAVLGIAQYLYGDLKP